jgi:hypothetical protein
VRLDELAEARRQLDEELANLHRELWRILNPKTGSRHRCRSRFRSNAMREMASGKSTVLQPSNLEPTP